MPFFEFRKRVKGAYQPFALLHPCVNRIVTAGKNKYYTCTTTSRPAITTDLEIMYETKTLTLGKKCLFFIAVKEIGDVCPFFLSSADDTIRFSPDLCTAKLTRHVSPFTG